MRTTFKSLTYMLAIGVLFISCTTDSVEGDIGPIGPKGEQGIQGEKGEQGPAGQDGKDGEAQGIPGEKGDQGEQGEQGEDGNDGENGQDGEDGNANVIYSDWFTVEEGNWDGLGSSILRYEFNIPELTEEIENTGAILIYHRFAGRVRQLPYLYTAGYMISYTTIAPIARLEYFHLDGTAIPSTASLEFRYVIIPANVLAGKGALDYTKMSYEELTGYFGLDY